MLRDLKIRMSGLLQEMLVEELDPGMFRSKVCTSPSLKTSATVALRLLV